jgi:predicted molibdopterin-dependent oxidoreductase YjgC
VVLPSPTWAERAGHLTNMEGKVRALDAILAAPEGVSAEWQPLVSLAKKLGKR